MNIIDSILLGIVAGLVSLKVVLLAAAAMLLLYAMTWHFRHCKATPAAGHVRHARSGKSA